MKKIFLHFIWIFLVLTACQDGDYIASNGSSKYNIIIPSDASKSDSTAARYLSKYIKAITKAEIAILSDAEPLGSFEICIGNTNRLNLPVNSFEPDGYLINVKDEKLFIAGGVHKGSIYGVIDLLESWGCRYFSPGEAYIPERKRLKMPLAGIFDAPVNSLRIINGVRTADEEYTDWLRISTITEVSPPGYYVHTFERLLPKEKYFKDHPEYYAWLGNKHSFDQPCPSNEKVKEIIIEKLGKEMELHPEFDIWSVSQNDNFTYCQCDKCMKIIEEDGSPAGPIIRLVNDVAAVYPDKTIATLAYQFSRQAPLKTKPADNVLIRLCTIELNRSKPISEDSMSASFVKDITDWGKISKNIYLWDYTINFNHSVSPFPNLKVLQPNMQFFYENNVRMQFPQSNLQTGHEFAGCKGKMLAALMWDPYVNIDSVKNDFLDHYYEDAAPYIKEYNDIMEAELDRSEKILYIYAPPNTHADAFLSAKNVEKYNALFNKAEATVDDNPELLNRVKLSRLPLQYAMMEIAKNDMFGPRGWYDERDERFILRQEMRQTLEDFYTVCKENEITTLNERRLTPKIYYQSTLRFIDVQVDDNLAFRKKVTTSPLPSEKYAKGDPMTLTNGVQGAHDFNVHWLGWWGEDARIMLDLEDIVKANKIEIGTLWDGRSWILHPAKISCMISKDEVWWIKIGTKEVKGDQQNEAVTRKYSFDAKGKEFRFLRFDIIGAGPLPKWHASEGEASWFFVDEITVR